jgi:F0F1-type ATP synthase gamma subunit
LGKSRRKHQTQRKQSFIKEFHDFSEEDIYRFDKFRQLRNDSVYKAIDIGKADADSCLLFASRFVNSVSKKL